MTIESRDRFLADFARVAPTLPGARAPWLSRVRRRALDRFAETGLPSQRDENWRYTSVAGIVKRPFTVLPDSAGRVTTPEIDAPGFGRFSPHRLVFVDGRYVPALSAMGPLPGGVTLGSLGETLGDASEALEPFLSDDRHHTVFATLNTAFMADGLYLHLSRGTAIAEPIHALFISTAEDAAAYPRNLIVAEDGAHATVIEHYAGLDGIGYLTNAVTQIFAAGNATIAHYKLQQETLRAFHIAGIHVAQSRASRLESHSIALGAALARNDITTAFDAEGCEATLNGLYLAGGRQHVDHHTRIDHAKPHGTSREYYKGILDGAARGVFNGKVVVHPGAQHTDAHLANHNLLLSKAAEVDTKPQLEIDADDVKCTHGATVGQLDDAQMFYLRSRGVDEAMARSLLTYAFAHDVIERIRIAPLRAQLEQVLFARLPQGDRIRELA
ncbi:MAG: Fe-S cluster assembly protein SufD [Pseudomonadota bacterium]|nr:Fe-S cluster assembly protein SufD [Pseudomonadota bacterium]